MPAQLFGTADWFGRCGSSGALSAEKEWTFLSRDRQPPNPGNCRFNPDPKRCWSLFRRLLCRLRDLRNMGSRPVGLLKYPPSRPTELVSVSFGLPHSIGCVRIRKCEGPKPTGASPVEDTSTAPRGCAPTGRSPCYFWLRLRRVRNMGDIDTQPPPAPTEPPPKQQARSAVPSA